MPRIAFYTLGCKVNQYESFSMMEIFNKAGFDIVPPEDDADVYIVNSCTVTATGDKKSLQALRRFRRQAPEAVLVLCGCFPQAFPEQAGTTPEADIVMGSKNRKALLSAVLSVLSGKVSRLVDIPSHAGGEPFEDMNALPLSNRTRAFLKIQDGCERYCSYCIIPHARGPVRSKPLGDIRRELEALVDAGYREVVLVGINLCCYGQELGATLADAVAAACETKGLSRVRLGSLEPELIMDGDIERWASFREGSSAGAALCPQFHLSLQSGCDETLRRMNRRYNSDDYRRLAEKLRAAFPGCALTTDVMVGFPGETQEHHLASEAFVRELGFARVHVFVYSPRPGTPAADMPGRIAPELSSRRAKEMAQAARESRHAFLQSRLGQVLPVLFESTGKDGLYHGYTPCYTAVWADSERDIRGRILSVRMTAISGDGCMGVLE